MNGKTFVFRCVRYESGMRKCQYAHENGRWRVTGLNVPDCLRKRGYSVETEDINEKDHKESVKNGSSEGKRNKN